MSRWYKNEATGLHVVTGKVKEISEDRMVMTVETETYDRAARQTSTAEVKVSSGIPYEDNYKVGLDVVAVGYPRGKGTIAAEGVFMGNETFETPDLAVVTGFVKFARLNEEKNADGTPKMKQDGVTPKKPHFDVTITVREGDRYVDHVIKVYEGIHEEGKKSQMDKVAAVFKNFDAKTNRIVATFVTAPGQEYSRPYTRTDNTEGIAYGCSHMGYKSMDVKFIDDKERTQTAPKAEKTPAAPAPAQPQQQAPVQSGAGFETDLGMDEEEMFQ